MTSCPASREWASNPRLRPAESRHRLPGPIRHSKNTTGPAIIYTPAEMDAFFDGVKKGEFDNLLA